jgi:hypothetical protein
MELKIDSKSLKYFTWPWVLIKGAWEAIKDVDSSVLKDLWVGLVIITFFVACIFTFYFLLSQAWWTAGAIAFFSGALIWWMGDKGEEWFYGKTH